MPASNITFIPGMSNDSRVRVYRSSLSGLKDFEGMEVDGYLIVTDRFVLLCDTLLRPEDMSIVTQAIADELATRPLLVMNSHADWDHAWGNGYFMKEYTAPIIAHDYCRQRLESEEGHKKLADFQTSYPDHFQTVMLAAPTITFTDRLRLSGGDLTIELFSTPGHCQDHIAAWIPELQLLLAFDAVETPLPLLGSAAGTQSMFTTLEHFLSLQPQRVLCSHGGTTSPGIVKANLTYFREVERRCRMLLAQRRPTEEELEHGPTLINYSLDNVLTEIAGMIEIPDPLDRTFYSRAHNGNIRAVMQWLMS